MAWATSEIPVDILLKGVSVSVRDLNNGTIVVSGKVTSAGDFTLDVNTEAKGTKGSAPVPLITAEGVCSAGANCPAKCIIEPADVVMRAGEEGLVTVSRVDAWGNKLKSSVGEVGVVPDPLGMEATWLDAAPVGNLGNDVADRAVCRPRCL